MVAVTRFMTATTVRIVHADYDHGNDAVTRHMLMSMTTKKAAYAESAAVADAKANVDADDGELGGAGDSEVGNVGCE